MTKRDAQAADYRAEQLSPSTPTAAIRREIEAFRSVAWGWDGDCGTDRIIDRIEEECDRLDARLSEGTP
jgi:hypothetical protein